MPATDFYSLKQLERAALSKQARRVYVDGRREHWRQFRSGGRVLQRRGGNKERKEEKVEQRKLHGAGSLEETQGSHTSPQVSDRDKKELWESRLTMCRHRRMEEPTGVQVSSPQGTRGRQGEEEEGGGGGGGGH